jgi:hypothetical protein
VVPPAHQWAVLAAWAVASSTVGFLYFWAGEEGYGHD